MKKALTCKIQLLALLFVMLCATVKANDGVYYVSGNHLVPMQETDISVRKEVLTIYLQNDGFAYVDVSYEFWNPGKTTKKLLMGFEASGPGDNADYEEASPTGHPFIYNFTVEMNGRKLGFQNSRCLGENFQLDSLLSLDSLLKEYPFLQQYPDKIPDSIRYEYDRYYYEYNYVYYFEADFQPGLNKVHHTYRYRMGASVYNPWNLYYSLTPAARWAGGKIDDFTLVVHSDKTTSHFFMPLSVIPEAEFAVVEGFGKMRRIPHKMYAFYEDNADYDYDQGTDCYEVYVRNGAVSWHKKDFRPKSEMEIDCSNFDDELRDIYANEGLFDPYTSIWLWLEDDTDATPDKEFKKRVVRNLPYAKRGRVFKDKKLKEFFEGMWWYMPDPKYKDSTDDFSERDWLYINYSNE